ncbi:argininosuccinate lyase [Caldisericum exile]|uniref:Argininosuccinate lyase n=1 Tax=Caldisericum exile (strain DSM 21853 / NBRC 104410 / AZM16c01) TaxID=511051 RepID=A0A7U6JFP5_CALEA|nr:argininosuccinate lyase [Caldisericum exile]BAL80405.1 putative argininosuccinate lyase [Caldisericum exile AZM16c01]
MAKLWKKKGIKENDTIIRFTVGNDYLFDRRLVKYDCLCSIAHAKMLNKIGILTDSEVNAITKTLEEIIHIDSKGKFQITPNDEDVHTKIENYLVEKLGDVGKKIHTARSRNDQVLCTLRLYYKSALKDIEKIVVEIINALKIFKRKYGKVQIPGFTHTRKAMVSSIKLWADSFIEALTDELKFGKSVYELIDKSPLGTGAGYGVPVLKIDRNYTKKILGFKTLQYNPIYVQNSRGKFEGEILSFLTMIMYDINKLVSDIIFFSEDDLGFIKIPVEFTTGSSIMPHKKNPDVFEIARSKYSKLLSLEMRVKILPSNLISGYHRDLQETKECVFEGFDTVKETLIVLANVLSKLEVDKTKAHSLLTQELYATEEVYKLVLEGVPFREAYKIIGEKYLNE